MRTSLASLLILLGFMLTFSASLALWEQREIRDEDAFVMLGEDVLAKPPVQQAIADQIGDQVREIVRQNTSSPPPRPIIDAITLSAIQNLSQSNVASDALRDTHRLLARIADLQESGKGPIDQGDNGTLVLDLRKVAQNLLANAQILGPSLQGHLVIPPDTGRIVIVRDTEIETGIKLLRDLDDGAQVLELLPFVFFGLALLIAPNKGLALMVIGGAIAGGAALRLFLLKGPLASLLRDLLAETPTAQGAGLATYDTFVSSFTHQDTMVLIAGGAVAAAGLLVAILLHRSY